MNNNSNELRDGEMIVVSLEIIDGKKVGSFKYHTNANTIEEAVCNMKKSLAYTVFKNQNTKIEKVITKIGEISVF